ncbi:hypothetical protein F5X68DRAFT_244995 [Plectosphaerella plurivora]|uniref:Zn(2)-C6 fungal-type domain-containing protein n=1 Tax=Plectosphaerella plurivora TaxID=936078 RepID=A0A9P9A683_9PEZI|nr:hypothetical protein F5X68DRAFT_244995 [Plectosphaerella plurivora]
MSSRKLPPIPPPISTLYGHPKRRNIRKGTLSCWECKRRKTKCTFTGGSFGSTCDGCRRRGVSCVSQEFPQDVSNTKQHLGDRLGRVERLVSQLADKTGEASESVSDGHVIRKQSDPEAALAAFMRPKPRSLFTTTPRSAISDAAPTSSTHASPNEALLEAWPNPVDLEAILRTSITSSDAFHGIICMPYAEFKEQRLPSPRELLLPPSPEAHPVTIARKLLTLASLLQHVAPQELADRLSTNQQTLMSRAVETTARLVNSIDDFASTMEGVECIMMESMYYNNAGNLRRAYITMRRALTIAQTLGLDRPGPSPLLRRLDSSSRDRLSPEHMWYRIVQSDRYLSLMLGLPHGSFDDDFADPEVMEACTPVESLERVLTMAGGRIIQRARSKTLDLDETLRIDKMVLEAAALMPPQWWLSVNTTRQDKGGTDAIDATLSMTTQLAYYHVLGRLHFPYLLRSSDDRRYDYSRMTAITSSRELLLRFLAFRGSVRDVGTYCRGIDFLMFIASTALCIGHIHSSARCHLDSSDAEANSKAVPSALAHQRLTDRGLLEAVLEIMEEAGTIEPCDPIAAKIAVILRPLLVIEGRVAQGEGYRAAATDEHEGVDFECHGTASNDGRSLFISLPHLGAIKIERLASIQNPNKGLSYEGDDALRAEEEHRDGFGFSMLAPRPGESAGVLPDDGSGGGLEVNMETDWVLQGVDLALIDSFSWGDATSKPAKRHHQQ